MATKKTIPATMERAISANRQDLATRAQYEISQTARLLRDAITEHNAEASIPMLWAPALLKRIELLSDATSECLGNGDDWDDATLEQIVMEASHG